LNVGVDSLVDLAAAAKINDFDGAAAGIPQQHLHKHKHNIQIQQKNSRRTVEVDSTYIFRFQIAVHDVDVRVQEKFQREQHLKRKFLDQIERHTS
jgi:hypothetical protein